MRPAYQPKVRMKPKIIIRRDSLRDSGYVYEGVSVLIYVPSI